MAQEPHIFEVGEAKDEYLQVINRLMEQLTTSGQKIDSDRLRRIVESDASRLFLLNVGGTIAGMLTLGIYHTPTGCKVWVEDLVVDREFRNRHLGRMMVDKAIEAARQYAPCTLMLTSRPARVAANALYQSAGLAHKTTNVYKIDITR